MNIIYAEEGKVFRRIGGTEPLGFGLILGKGDSIDNYEQIEWEEEVTDGNS